MFLQVSSSITMFLSSLQQQLHPIFEWCKLFYHHRERKIAPSTNAIDDASDELETCSFQSNKYFQKTTRRKLHFFRKKISFLTRFLLHWNSIVNLLQNFILAYTEVIKAPAFKHFKDFNGLICKNFHRKITKPNCYVNSSEIIKCSRCIMMFLIKRVKSVFFLGKHVRFDVIERWNIYIKDTYSYEYSVCLNPISWIKIWLSVMKSTMIHYYWLIMSMGM